MTRWGRRPTRLLAIWTVGYALPALLLACESVPQLTFEPSDASTDASDDAASDATPQSDACSFPCVGSTCAVSCVACAAMCPSGSVCCAKSNVNATVLCRPKGQLCPR